MFRRYFVGNRSIVWEKTREHKNCNLGDHPQLNTCSRADKTDIDWWIVMKLHIRETGAFRYRLVPGGKKRGTRIPPVGNLHVSTPENATADRTSQPKVTLKTPLFTQSDARRKIVGSGENACGVTEHKGPKAPDIRGKGENQAEMRPFLCSVHIKRGVSLTPSRRGWIPTRGE